MKSSEKIYLISIVMLAALFQLSAQKNSDYIIRQSEGSISFVIDEDLPAPDEAYFSMNRDFATKMLLGEQGWGGNGSSDLIVASSITDEKLAWFGSNTMFNMMITAYAEHLPLVISPDDIWLLISQGVARHINLNDEQLRNKLVDHDGKIVLQVESKQALLGDKDVLMDGEAVDGKVDWTLIFDGFVNTMRQNTKGDIVDRMCADFTTTTIDSRIASQITLMNALQPFFNYEVIRVVCGIPYITIKGTPEDWQKILDRTRSLAEYDLKWWTDKLCPVLEQFVSAAEGKPDRQFWRCMVMKIAPDKIRGGGCIMDVPTQFDGWFLNLFPYDNKGRTPESVTKGHKMLSDLLFVDFIYKVVDKSNNVMKETPMQFYSGFVGAAVNEESYEMTPRIGWLVVTNESGNGNQE